MGLKDGDRVELVGPRWETGGSGWSCRTVGGPYVRIRYGERGHVTRAYHDGNGGYENPRVLWDNRLETIVSRYLLRKVGLLERIAEAAQ